VNTVMSLKVPPDYCNLFASWGTVSFSGRAVLSAGSHVVFLCAELVVWSAVASCYQHRHSGHSVVSLWSLSSHAPCTKLHGLHYNCIYERTCDNIDGILCKGGFGVPSGREIMELGFWNVIWNVGGR
jgi:hypothetical protein